MVRMRHAETSQYVGLSQYFVCILMANTLASRFNLPWLSGRCQKVDRAPVVVVRKPIYYLPDITQLAAC